jgi:hypothetical protein
MALHDTAEKERGPSGIVEKFGNFCFCGALVCVMAAPIFVLSNHAGYMLAGWFATGLFAAGFLLDVIKRITPFLRLFGLAFAGAMAAALVVLPAPTMAMPEGESETSWSVDLSAVDDETGEPVRRAVANCAAVMAWNRSPEIFRAGRGQITGEDGRAQFPFRDDTRLKAAACIAFLPATTEAQGYAPQTAINASILPGQTLPIEIRLKERTLVGSNCSAIDSATSCATYSYGGEYEFEASDEH